ncbi:MAG TPA: phosphotransferase [Pseudonocardia sp.]|nr:phosphotransferase [Pseudonocardia sp.]
MSDAAAGSPVPLLDETGEIDAAWLESVLALNYPGVRVRGVRMRPIGAGNVSDTRHIVVEYDQRPDGAPDAVVAKFKPSSPEVHEHGLGSGAYHREIGAYRAITERAACRIPRLHHVAGDETNINLIIEDLTSAVPGNQVAGCGVGEARAVLTELAHLHATFFPAEPTTAPSWPIRLADVADYWTGATRTGSAAALERYRDRLDALDLDAVAGVADVVHDWHRLPQTRLTLTHGDPRVDNVLFEQVDGATRAVLIDWQVTGLRNPMYDVGYFLSGSISIDDRRAHEDALLEHYLREFATVRAGYSRADALHDYRTQVLSGLVITTAAISVLPDNDAVNTLILALLERNCAAVRDWDALTATRERTTGRPQLGDQEAM